MFHNTDDGAESLDIVYEGGQTGASTSDMEHVVSFKQQGVATTCCAYTINCLVALT